MITQQMEEAILKMATTEEEELNRRSELIKKFIKFISEGVSDPDTKESALIHAKETIEYAKELGLNDTEVLVSFIAASAQG